MSASLDCSLKKNERRGGGHCGSKQMWLGVKRVMAGWWASGWCGPELQCLGYETPPNGFVPGVIETGGRNGGTVAGGWITTFGTVGMAWEGWGREGMKARGALTRNDKKWFPWWVRTEVPLLWLCILRSFLVCLPACRCSTATLTGDRLHERVIFGAGYWDPAHLVSFSDFYSLPTDTPWHQAVWNRISAWR